MTIALRPDESIVQWLAPAPLWPDSVSRPAFTRPCVLRFATDSFMDDLLGVLNSRPDRLREFRAVPETWTEPGVGSRPSGAAPMPLKLYHAAHQRFYLVATCLVCRLPGLPDRMLNISARERATFVIRRLNPITGDEFALVPGPNGAIWQPATADALVPGEDQIPLFPLTYRAEDGRARRLFGGLIPTGKREAYAGAPLGAAAPTAAEGLPKTARKILFRTKVIEPWKSLLEQGASALRGSAVDPNFPDQNPPEDQAPTQLTAAREQIQVTSWYVLLDFANYLKRYLPSVWSAMANPEFVALTAAERAVFDALEATTLSAGLAHELGSGSYTPDNIAASLRDALAYVTSPRARELEDATSPYDRQSPGAPWPSFLFPLVDPTGPEWVVPGITAADDLEAAQKKLDSLAALIVRALPTDSTLPTPPIPLAAQTPFGVGREPAFVIRCVFERPTCGPIAPPILSDPTDAFQLASFFDSDAPARPIRIALPLDTSPGGLRKFDKNTAFMISDVLCGQIKRARGLSLGDLVRSVLPWPLHADLPTQDTGPCSQPDGSLALGMICSLSIPIITICALILLMIIVGLLDIIFRWIPYFIMCFPLPGFSAKGRSV